MDGLDPNRFAQQFVDDFRFRMMGEDFEEPEIEENLGIIHGFIGIALAEIQKQGEIEIPGTGQAIPFDENVTGQTIGLFTEGLYYGMQRCRDMGITGDLKTFFLQSLALELFNQAKQMVITTFGQEHTPEIQFSFDQQVNFINQFAESGLLYLVNEHEKEHGPINPEPGVYDFGPADAFVAFGEAHDLFVVGHTLVWHNQTPAWFFEGDDGTPAVIVTYAVSAIAAPSSVPVISAVPATVPGDSMAVYVPSP